MSRHRPLTFDDGADAAAAHAAGFSPSRLLKLTDILNADVDNAVIPGAVVLIVRRGITAYFNAAGYADRQTLQPLHRDSLFRIASMTKPLTAAAALMLMERGNLPLTDPVSKYLPQLGDLPVGVETVDAAAGRRLTLERAERAMTLLDLMRHSAGFTYGLFGDSLVQRAYRDAELITDRQTNAGMVDKLSQLPLLYQPGTTFEYGMSTDVLGRVVEIASGMDLDRFFATHITGPLGMIDTTFGVPAGALGRLAQPHRDEPPSHATAMLPYDPARPATWFSGGGGLLSTAADYTRFAQMLLHQGEFAGGRLLGRKTVQLMTQNHLTAGMKVGTCTAELGIGAPLAELGQGYGLGLGVRTHDAPAATPGSRGEYYWGGATGPYFWADPSEDLTVVLMLQELDAQRRIRYRSLVRALVYQALE